MTETDAKALDAVNRDELRRQGCVLDVWEMGPHHPAYCGVWVRLDYPGGRLFGVAHPDPKALADALSRLLRRFGARE